MKKISYFVLFFSGLALFFLVAPVNFLLAQNETSGGTIASAQASKDLVSASGNFVQAAFPGGEEAMVKFVYDNTNYPVDARELGISGTVVLSFVVDEDGNITKVNVVKGIGGGCDEAAIKMIENMPKWEPAKLDDAAVAANLQLPVRFRLH